MRDCDSPVSPDVKWIAEYLSTANLPKRLADPHDDELWRVAAVRALHAIWRSWLESVAQIRDRGLVYDIELLAIQLLRERWIRAGAPADFDRALRDFFDRAGRAIFRHPDPVAAMRDFWEGPQKRGKRGRRPEDHTDRNARIAYEVAVDIERGSKYEAAVAAVAEREGLSRKTVGNAVRQAHGQLKFTAINFAICLRRYLFDLAALTPLL